MTDTPAFAAPNHIGFIMDGNRRWARSHSLPAMDGHMAGYNAMKEVLFAALDHNVPFVTIYAFSSENWQRQKEEVSGLMKILARAIASDLGTLIEKQIRVRFLSDLNGLSKQVLAAIQKAEAETAHLTRATLGVCFNYGGQQEIVHAVRACMQDGLSPEQIDDQAVTARLYAPEIPPLDIIVRTSGEQRLSNFMLWRAAYSELLFLDKFWPDMTKTDVADIIEEYNRRQRRFGA